MKKLAADKQIEAVKAELQRDIDRWNEINQNGCDDPFWSDGVNMNLKRNHIINDLRRLAELERKDVQLSVFMLIGNTIDDVMGDSRIPPKVPDNYMVHDRLVDGRRKRLDIVDSV